MKVDIEHSTLNGIKVIKPQVFEDSRGLFTEMYRKDTYNEKKLDLNIVQVNYSRSTKNTLRGLHFQWDPLMGKLMTVLSGKAFLVAVDIRHNSKHLGEWFGLEVSADDRKFVWAPAGFARGFVALSETTDIQYFTTGIYNAECESGILWSDPSIGIKWPIKTPELSDKDRIAQTLQEWLQKDESAFFKL
tara:strand:- start:609 stop:1175 length:567 start_codon:yes stop_codon:yes gene_type:complete